MSAPISAPDLTKLLTVPGLLCTNPTNLATAFPHGGDPLGIPSRIVVKEGQQIYAVQDEILNRPVEILDQGRVWGIVATFRELDDHTLATALPVTAIGTGTQHRTVEDPGTRRPGAKLSDRAVALLFSPRDQTRHRFVYFPRAVPYPAPAGELMHHLRDPLEQVVIFRAIPDGAGIDVRWNFLGDLTL